MRQVHRWIAVFAVIFGLYVAATGVIVHVMDLRALLAHAPATDPTMQAIRVGINGPPNFQVIRDADYSAPTLPDDAALQRALATVGSAARRTIGTAPIRYLELRSADGEIVGNVASGDRLLRFDASTGALMGAQPIGKLAPVSQPSPRNSVKSYHSMIAFTPWALILDIATAVSLLAMIVTGGMVYWKLLSQRRKMRKANPFWLAGGWWRTLHRGTALTSAVFLAAIALTGALLAINAAGINIKRALNNGQRPGLTADVSSPLPDSTLPSMFAKTIAAYRADQGSAPIKVLRLRIFAGMPQGVIVGGSLATRQFAYNLDSGSRARLSGPNYPDTDMPLGWHTAQLVKTIHRGDILGLTGRWIALLSGLALIYLVVSGAVIYFDLLGRRRKAGRKGLFWR